MKRCKEQIAYYVFAFMVLLITWISIIEDWPMPMKIICTVLAAFNFFCAGYFEGNSE